MFGKLRKVLQGGSSDRVSLSESDRLRLSGKALGVLCPNRTLVIEMGKQTLHVSPDFPPDGPQQDWRGDYLVYDPDRYAAGISNCLRLAVGSTLSIDHREPYQKLALSHPRDAFRRHLQIRHDGESLVFRDPISELGTYLSLCQDPDLARFALARRQRSLEQISEIFGGPIQRLPTEEALELLKDVNRIMADDAYREKDSMDNAGGLLELPRHIAPVIVGDLHGQVDNLLKVLSENAFLQELDRGQAAFVLLGDAVHPEGEGQLENMDSSVLIMDLILALKRRYPKQVFFLVGNHDGFSPDVMKGGVPQGVIWQKRVAELRGDTYLQELDRFYRQSPLVVLSRDFVACHAGPPRQAVSRESLVEIRQFPHLMHDITWNRIKTRAWPMGYTRGDVKRFRKSLGLDEALPFIVAHYPQDAQGSIWMDVGEIPNHHLLYSAQPWQVGVITRVDGQLLPLIYPAERLVDAVNARAAQTR
jgi:hypothetical protein